MCLFDAFGATITIEYNTMDGWDLGTEKFELIGNFIITSTKPEFLFIRRVTTKHKLGYRLVLCLVVLMLFL